MKPQPSNSVREWRRKNASVLIVVLWIAIGMLSIALYFANSMTYELRASDNRVSGLAADQAIEGAARYVGFVLYNYATNGAMPLTNQYQTAAVPLGNAFALRGRACRREVFAFLRLGHTFEIICVAGKAEIGRAHV